MGVHRLYSVLRGLRRIFVTNGKPVTAPSRAGYNSVLTSKVVSLLTHGTSSSRAGNPEKVGLNRLPELWKLNVVN